MISFLVLVSWVISCSSRKGNVRKLVAEDHDLRQAELSVTLIKMVSPSENEEYKLKDKVTVSLIPEKGTPSCH